MTIQRGMLYKGWWVTIAGLVLNLALGVLYAWSVFGKQLTEPIEKGGYGWSKTEAALPYTIAIGVFALMMVPAGRMQDKMGPRTVATMGAVLTSAGLLIAGFSTPEYLLPALIGFGILAGMGFGLGYAAATPAAVKWFPAEKKGLITGIVVSGFGLAPVYIAPLSKYLLGNFGIQNSFRLLGLFFAVFAVFAARGIVNPSEAPEMKPMTASQGSPNAKNAAPVRPKNDYTWAEMLQTRTFYLLWITYAFAATAGLMIIGHLAKIVALQSGGAVKAGFLFVALLAIFNASGRLLAGIASDKIGRIKTLFVVCMLQAAAMFSFSGLTTATAFTLGSAVVGFSYGACLSLFPSTTADFFGTKNLGLNYGILFTAWGVGGVFGPLLAGKIADSTGSYELAYLISSCLMVGAALVTFFTKAPVRKEINDTVVETAAAYKVRS